MLSGVISHSQTMEVLWVLKQQNDLCLYTVHYTGKADAAMQNCILAVSLLFAPPYSSKMYMMLINGSNGFGWHSLTGQSSHTLFRALSHTFAQAEMNCEENQLHYIHSDLLWGMQAFGFRPCERNFKVSGTIVYTPSFIDGNFLPLSSHT